MYRIQQHSSLELRLLKGLLDAPILSCLTASGGSLPKWKEVRTVIFRGKGILGSQQLMTNHDHIISKPNESNP
jgi:hypothetical protein